MQTFKVSLALTLLSFILLNISKVSYAETSNDPPPIIHPRITNENSGKKILFDNTHAQTAGAADWVIDGGFSDFGNALADNGFYVTELRKTTPITYGDLKEYDVFIIGEANIPYKTHEQDAMLQYVRNGGSIFFIGDHYNADRNKNRWDANEVFNGYRRGAWHNPAKGMDEEEAASLAMQEVQSLDWLGENFGIRFRYNALGDLTINVSLEAHEIFNITAGVNKISMHAGSTLVILDPTKAKGVVYLPKTNSTWGNASDIGNYNGGGIEEGPYVAIAKLGTGKAAFIGDSSPVEDATPKYMNEETGGKKKTFDGFKEANNSKLLVNLVNWLANKEAYTVFDETMVTLSPITTLLDFENPINSTETKLEPWDKPKRGYMWYDSATFAPGSYGSSEEKPVEPVGMAKFSIENENPLPNRGRFEVRIIGEHLQPHQTLSNLRIGIFVVGGAQVGQLMNEDGSWPSSYDYSEPFSIRANSEGVAVKTLTLRVKPGTTGSANLRLRQGSTNLLTELVVFRELDDIEL